MFLSDVIIILARPSEAGNAGAVCRAMKNMGLSRLRLTAPEFSAGNENGGKLAVIKARAVHAWNLWEEAQTFNSLAEAVKDCSLVIGTTRRRGHHRKRVSMTPKETAAFLKEHPGNAALVFGNERTGLQDSEMELCNLASHIPADEIFPSLNLSHAVMIYAYELFTALEDPQNLTVRGQWTPMDQEKINVLVCRLTDRLKDLGFYKNPGREEQERFYRDLFSRAGLTEREALYLVDNIAKAARLETSGGSRQT